MQTLKKKTLSQIIHQILFKIIPIQLCNFEILSAVHHLTVIIIVNVLSITLASVRPWTMQSSGSRQSLSCLFNKLSICTYTRHDGGRTLDTKKLLTCLL